MEKNSVVQKNEKIGVRIFLENELLESTVKVELRKEMRDAEFERDCQAEFEI